ncbi:MAG: hypothetical protein AAGJ83_11690 [Planctomycetota bacterium]
MTICAPVMLLSHHYCETILTSQATTADSGTGFTTLIRATKLVEALIISAGIAAIIYAAGRSRDHDRRRKPDPGVFFLAAAVFGSILQMGVMLRTVMTDEPYADIIPLPIELCALVTGQSAIIIAGYLKEKSKRWRFVFYSQLARLPASA